MVKKSRIMHKVRSHSKHMYLCPSTLKTQKKLTICSYSSIVGNVTGETHNKLKTRKQFQTTYKICCGYSTNNIIVGFSE